MFKKFYKRLIFYFFNKFKAKFEIVSYDNFLNLIKYYEDNLPESDLFEISKLPFNEERYKILSQQIGTEPTEAFFIIKSIHESLKIDGDICEFGVAQGQTSLLIANELKNFSDKNLYLFDSFEGLPKPTKEDMLINDIFKYGDIVNYEGSMKCPQKMVIKKLKKINFPKDRYKIFKGFVDNNFDQLKNLPSKVSFAYIDFDFYEPIKIVLEFLLNKTDSGSFILVDDYDFFSSGVKLAVDNFLERNAQIFEFFVAPKSIGNFIILKRIK